MTEEDFNAGQGDLVHILWPVLDVQVIGDEHCDIWPQGKDKMV